MSFLPLLSVSGCAGVRLDPFPEGPLLPRTPANQRVRAGPVAAGSSPYRGTAACPGLPPAEFGLHRGGGRVGLRASRGELRPAAAGARGGGAWRRLPRPSRRGRLAVGHDPALCSRFQAYLCPFQFSVTLRKGETKQKSLFISFQGL
ncbi:PREDICTED: uncharacterized protein LOC108638406 [Capra hircus]|uniref:uncharacterized protein LOC108638406 n=1 Tax=Capra hircus TaxID=9925 RepID=UPI00084645B5|nr:PREDICTED: uncharacterized protein LOC108638406 [Capra hircus]